MATSGISQIRFYKNGHKKNAPFENYNSYAKDFDFTKYNPIRKCSVYALPGTKVYVNGMSTPYVLGPTGVLNFDFSDRLDPLTKIRIDEQSMEIINNNPEGYLIINLIHDDGQ